MRTLALNRTYYIFYRVVGDSSSLITLNKQIYPGAPEFLLSEYNHATNKFYGYILLDLNHNALENLHVVTDIFDSEINLYIPLNSKKVH